MIKREKCHVIRAQYGAIGDELQGRMPLAYAHIVQVLLDVVLWMYPFMVRPMYYEFQLNCRHLADILQIY